MKLYVDGDALPNILKPILFRAIERLTIETVVVANKRVTLGPSKSIKYEIVSEGPDAADDRIVALIAPGDLVITADIPLADRIITQNAHAIDHRGSLFTEENVKYYLSVRNFMQDLRDAGGVTNGPPPFSKKEAQNFANQLDRFLTKHFKTH